MLSLRLRIGSAAAVAALAVGMFGSAPAAAAKVPPAHVFDPYFETWTTDNIWTIAQASGARYFTLAFLETTGKSSCTLAWNGSRSDTVANGRYLDQIATLRANGGDVYPSLGGWSADQGGTEIGDSCKDVNSIAAAYEALVLKYDLSRIDMDIEGKSLTNTAGIDRRNKAIKILEDWAAANGRPLTISFTVPTSAQGLESTGVALLQNAIANGTRVDIVDIMAFDYYDRVTTDMGAAAQTAANGTYNQLHTLYPSKTSAQLWAMIGITLLPGIDDYPRRTEVTYQKDAQSTLTFAQANGLSMLSIWAIQRDHPGCDGQTDSNTCSGIPQTDYEFTHILMPFTA